MKLREDGAAKLYGVGSSLAERRDAFVDGDVPVAVYGLGKMGLPLAVVYAGVTSNVVGVDVDEEVVARINDGDCHVEGEPRLPELTSAAVNAGAFRASADPPAAASEASVHVVIVPTTLREDQHPDLSNLRTAVRDIASGLEAGDAVFVESTVPPGTCEDVVEPVLVEESGLAADQFGLAFCPERTSSGRALKDIRGAYPKVVGGTDAESTAVAETVYGELTVNDVVPVSDATTAECVKVFEGVYRDVNIALANELATFTDELGIDVNEAIEVANTQPFCEIHDPGVGVGGHCIPYYPYFLIRELASDAPLLRTAREVNDGMPTFAVRKLVEGLQRVGTHVEDAAVLVLGVTYRPGVKETRKTPARPIAEKLNQFGATVVAADPMIEDFSEFDAYGASVDSLTELDLDAAVLVTDHEEFEGIDWTAFDDDLVVVDGRDALDLEDTDHHVYTVGSG
ncbi:nucleotide sugar dehydrogenase [Halostella salina]|uniref:nucleotide sugar dehydrogenase n=1 Tax=Halostella salina TaxID=1547897 RepID=UPI001F09B399|nr:nucleotide sugar dehydrogenase [Halostella salina]